MTGSSALRIDVIVTAVLVVFVLIFIAQNSQTVSIRYFGMKGHLSLALALLSAMVAGVLLMSVPGTARILQLRREIRRIRAASPTPLRHT